jgi:hypothetical protein
MFKKIIFIFLFSIIPSYAIAEEPIENVTEYVIPDQHTINLATVYTDVYRYFNNKKNKPQIEISYSPNFDSSLVINFTSAYKTASSFFAIPQSQVIFFNKNEINWYKEKMISINSFYDQHWLNSQCFSYWDFCSMNPMTRNPQYYHAINPNYKKTINDEFTVHHEVAHGYQNMINATKHPNCWFIEGQANTLAFSSILEYKINELDEMRSNTIKQIYNILPNFKSLDKKIMIESFINLQKDRIKCHDSGVGYSLGMMLTEYLYFSYDEKIIEEFSSYASQTQSFDSALNKYFNINENEFYDKAFDHVIESLKKTID